jgi:hypothetical protein
MGSFRLGNHPQSIRIYDAIGQDAKDIASFVGHIGLSNSSIESQDKQIVLAKMVEMCPPLVVPKTEEEPDPDFDRVDVVGSVELSAAETKQISLFIDETSKELESVPPKLQYTVHPHFRERAETDSARRYSCVGYVQQAYEYADIDLVDIDAIPEVELETILPAYPDSREQLEHPRARAFVGLRGDGPWPVLLPGYVFHAMNRPPLECRTTPYKPQAGDEYFPRREAEQPVPAES